MRYRRKAHYKLIMLNRTNFIEVLCNNDIRSKNQDSKQSPYCNVVSVRLLLDATCNKFLLNKEIVTSLYSQVLQENKRIETN